MQAIVLLEANDEIRLETIEFSVPKYNDNELLIKAGAGAVGQMAIQFAK